MVQNLFFYVELQKIQNEIFEATINKSAVSHKQKNPHQVSMFKMFLKNFQRWGWVAGG